MRREAHAARQRQRSDELEARADEMLLDVLRRELGLRRVRETCGIGVCGACTVLLDGEPVSGCLLLAPLAEGREVTTVEGLGGDHPVQRAFAETHALPVRLLHARDGPDREGDCSTRTPPGRARRSRAALSAATSAAAAPT